MAKKKQVTAVVPVGNYKTRVSDQYRIVCEKTDEFFREVVKFGALLNEVADFIGAIHGGSHEGGSIKAWLEENCPDVDYNTAMGYKAMAAKCVTMIGGGSQAIAALQGREIVQEPGTGETIDVDCRILEARDRLFNEVDSRRKLEQMWFKFCGGSGEKSKGGRPKAEKTEFVMKPKEENAADIWAGIKADFEGPAAQKAVKYLNAEAATAVLDSLRRLVVKFEEHLAKISK